MLIILNQIKVLFFIFFKILNFYNKLYLIKFTIFFLKYKMRLINKKLLKNIL